MEIASAPDADNYYNQYPIVSARTFFGVLGGVFVFFAIIACICDRYGPPQRGINNDPPSTLSRPPSSADDRRGAPIQIVIQRDALPLCTFRQLKGAAAASCCTICLGNYKDGEPVRVLPECCHVFHRSCIDPWLRIHATCPNCRNSTPSAAATQ